MNRRADICFSDLGLRRYRSTCLFSRVRRKVEKESNSLISTTIASGFVELERQLS